eukprot:gene32231-37075_t
MLVVAMVVVLMENEYLEMHGAMLFVECLVSVGLVSLWVVLFE